MDGREEHAGAEANLLRAVRGEVHAGSEAENHPRIRDPEIDRLAGHAAADKLRSALSMHHMKIDDPERDRLLEQSRQVTDPTKRKEVFHKISMRILEMKWGIDTIYVPRWDVWHPHVKNYYNHYIDRPTYRNSWLER